MHNALVFLHCFSACDIAGMGITGYLQSDRKMILDSTDIQSMWCLSHSFKFPRLVSSTRIRSKFAEFRYVVHVYY